MDPERSKRAAMSGPTLPNVNAERQRSGSSGIDPGSAFDAFNADDEKMRRRAARQIIAAYHEEELGRLLEHVRTGFARMEPARLTTSSSMT